MKALVQTVFFFPTGFVRAEGYQYAGAVWDVIEVNGLPYQVTMINVHVEEQTSVVLISYDVYLSKP